jgi:Tfp pilus assembly ATPase PilU
MSMRAIKTEVPPLEQLNLPEVIGRLTYLPARAGAGDRRHRFG